MRGVLILAAFAAILTTGCSEVRTDLEKCEDYAAEFYALEACRIAFDCRLTDSQWARRKHTSILAIQYCRKAGRLSDSEHWSNGGDTDKDVQPPAKEEEPSVST
jgi:hypothetical protein